jgi:hypothetical protein
MSSYLPPIPTTPWPIYDAFQFSSLDSNASMSYINQNFLKLTGGNLTGPLNMINATMSGNLVMGAISTIQSLNTSPSTSSITGALQVAGGAYFGANSRFDGDLTVASGNSHIYITGASGGLDLTGNNSVLNITGINSHLVLSNTEASTSSTSGAIKCSGGAYFGNGVLINSTLSLTNTNDAIQITNTSTTGRSNLKFINDTPISLEIGLRGSAASNPSTAYWYLNGAYRMLMSTSGDISILSTTQSSSYNTGCLQLSGGLAVSKLVYADSLKINSTTQSTAYTNGSVIISGGMGIAKKIICNDSIDCTFMNINTGTGIYIANGSRTALISILNTVSTNDLSLQSQPTGGVYGILNISSTGMLFQRSTGAPGATASCPIDLGSTLPSDCQINLFGNSYMIGANNDALKLLSGGTNGVYIGNGGSSVASGYTAQITTAGSLQVGASLRATGFSTTGFAGWAGAGLEIHYSTFGQIYAYNRSTLLYRGVYIGNEVYCDGGGHTSIGLGAVASSWRLEVGTNTQTVSSYGYLNSGGSTGTSGSSGSVAFSAYFQGRIAVQGEIDILSDRRLKSSIRDVSEDEASKFVYECDPKHYCFRAGTANEMQYGYIAQEVAKAGFNDLVVCRHDEGLEEVIDQDGFTSPKDTVFSISYQKIPALLHKFILMQEKRLNEQYDEINKLREDIDLLMSRPVVKNWLKKNKD